MDDRCFCIFEGGGAKGIAHVGALAALEQSELDLCGFAGTSAGAVIAALAAAGYRSRDMIGSDKTILDLVDMDRSNIWIGDPKQPARTPRRLFGVAGWAGIVAARNGGMVALLAIVTGILMLPSILVVTSTIPSSWAILAAIVSLLVIVGLACLIAAGLASLNEFERCLNQLLRLRLAARIDPATMHRARSPEPVTFEDMERAGCPPLRVVASDISTRQLKLFSYTSTPKMSVAAAVAASVCLPIIFGPRRIGARLHLDGGLVSNLPAWAFDAERALDPDAWTAVVQVSEDVKAERLWGVMILKAAVLTGIFGSGLLNVRNVDRLKAVRLDVTLKLLQFDPGIELANKVVEDARLKCVRELVYQLKAVPELMDDVCDRIRLRAERMINLALGIEGRSQFVGRLRVSAFVYASDDRSSLTADFQSGFGNSPDERIRLPLRGSIVGQALREEETLYLERRDPAWSKYLSKPSERWLRKLVSSELAWVLCIPYVKSEDGIEMVVSIDSTEYLAVESELVDTTMAAISDRIVLMLDEYVPKEAFAGGRS